VRWVVLSNQHFAAALANRSGLADAGDEKRKRETKRALRTVRRCMEASERPGVPSKRIVPGTALL
jgi:hypothetical protein